MALPTLSELAKRVQSALDKIKRLDKDVRGLKDTLNVHEVRSMIGKLVKIGTVMGDECEGILVWSDRYNIMLARSTHSHNVGRKRIYNKGAIAWIELSHE